MHADADQSLDVAQASLDHRWGKGNIAGCPTTAGYQDIKAHKVGQNKQIALDRAKTSRNANHPQTIQSVLQPRPNSKQQNNKPERTNSVVTGSSLIAAKIPSRVERVSSSILGGVVVCSASIDESDDDLLLIRSSGKELHNSANADPHEVISSKEIKSDSDLASNSSSDLSFFSGGLTSPEKPRSPIKPSFDCPPPPPHVQRKKRRKSRKRQIPSPIVPNAARPSFMSMKWSNKIIEYDGSNL